MNSRARTGPVRTGPVTTGAEISAHRRILVPPGNSKADVLNEAKRALQNHSAPANRFRGSAANFVRPMRGALARPQAALTIAHRATNHAAASPHSTDPPLIAEALDRAGCESNRWTNPAFAATQDSRADLLRAQIAENSKARSLTGRGRPGRHAANSALRHANANGEMLSVRSAEAKVQHARSLAVLDQSEKAPNVPAVVRSRPAAGPGAPDRKAHAHPGLRREISRAVFRGLEKEAAEIKIAGQHRAAAVRDLAALALQVLVLLVVRGLAEARALVVPVPAAHGPEVVVRGRGQNAVLRIRAQGFGSVERMNSAR